MDAWRVEVRESCVSKARKPKKAGFFFKHFMSHVRLAAAAAAVSMSSGRCSRSKRRRKPSLKVREAEQVPPPPDDAPSSPKSPKPIPPGAPRKPKKRRRRRPAPNCDGSYEVSQVMNWRMEKNRREYLVHWKGYTHNEDSWEPVSNVSSFLLKRFHERRKENSLASLYIADGNMDGRDASDDENAARAASSYVRSPLFLISRSHITSLAPAPASATGKMMACCPTQTLTRS